jgi:PAS domain S-box-containing protein
VLAAIDAVDSLSVLTFDTGLRLVRVAGAMLLRGDGATALVGHHPRELVDDEAWARLAPGYEGALAGRTTVVETPSLDGQRWYEATFRPIVSEGHVVGGTATFVDVTAERRDERRLDELREVLAACFDHSPVGQALLSPDGELMRVNAALRRLVDRTDEHLVGANVRDLTHPDDREREDALLRSVRGGERDGYDVDKRIFRGDGATLAVHAQVTAIRTREATLRGFIAHVDDAAHWTTGGAG